MRNLICVVLLATLMVVQTESKAQSLVVETWSGSTMDDQDIYTTIPTSFTIDLISTTSRINIYCTGGLADIGTISWSGSTLASSVDVIIGSGALNTDPEANLTNAAQNWGGVSFPFNTRLSGAIAGNLSGAINPVSIVRLEVHGALSGAITASATSGNAIGYLQIGSSTSTGTITVGNSSSGGNIRTLQTLSGTLAGAVSVLSGKIQNITCAGAIAIAASPGIAAQDGIDNIEAASVTVDVVANANSGDGDVQSVLVDGDFEGSLTGRDLIGPDETVALFYLDGVLDGTLSFRDIACSISVEGCAPGAAIQASNFISGGIDTDPPTLIEARSGDLGDIIAGVHLATTLGGGQPAALEIRADYGRINSLVADHHISTDANELYVFAGKGIGAIECDILDWPASIEIGDLDTGDPGRLGSLELEGLIGTLTLRSCDEIRVPRFRGLLHLKDGLPAGQVIHIGTLGPEPGAPYPHAHQITLGEEHGLGGQVVIDDDNAQGTYDPGEWTGTVRVMVTGYEGPVPIDLSVGSDDPDEAPHYNRLSAFLGGGAVGLLPYHLHKKECLPPHAPSESCDGYVIREWPASHGGEERETIVLPHYGPVFDSADDYGDPDDPGTIPLVIKRAPVVACSCAEDEWPVRTSLYDVYVPGNGSREVWVSRKLDDGNPVAIGPYSHEIHLALGENDVPVLRCDKTLHDPVDAPGVAGYPYIHIAICPNLTGGGGEE